MKKTIAMFCVCLCGISMLPAQYIVREAKELDILKKLPQEKVYIDHTGPLIFSGEYLYYSFDCFNAQTHTYSTFSKIGYVALVNESKELVFEQKIRLQEGRGQGDFFISTDIPSGNYKLLGYTQWMKNNGISQVFKEDLVIINPYRKDQSDLLGDINTPSAYEAVKVSRNLTSPILGFSTEKRIYGKRERINLLLTNYKENLGYGVYTIKVKKKSNFNVSLAIKAIDFSETYLDMNKSIPQKVGENVFLPEQRGELILGTLKDETTGNPVPDSRVVLSLPGDEFLMKYTTTDQDGNFYLYVDDEYKIPRAIVQVEKVNGKYNVEFNEKGQLDLSNLEFGDFRLQQNYSDEIRTRSVHNQIANQFFSENPDSVLVGKKRNPFGMVLPESKNLDEYTRFPTFQETLIELFPDISYRNNGKDPEFLRMEMKEGIFDGYYDAKPAIVLIDGVFIPNHEDIKYFDARKIESVSVVRDIYRIGNREYHGMMYIKTLQGDYYETYSSEYGSNHPIEAPLPVKNYYKQNYLNDGVNFNRLPDYRYILLWEPHVVINGNQKNFEFFTSDVEGEFEVILDGFTFYGKPISISTSFKVQANISN